MHGDSRIGKRSGGRILADQLLLHGADTGFCVPGESYLAVLDALHDHTDRFTLINARHEAGAANMAEAYGKLTGQPGICLVTRGPGACHGAIGVHIAQQDSTPMIMLVGQVARNTVDREAFQEIDYRAMFGTVAKWVAQIDNAARIPEYISRAFRVATSGRPGPVVLALPEDMLTDVVDVADAIPYTSMHSGITPRGLAAVQAELAAAQRPLVLVGGPGWTDEACAAITRFTESNNLPVACSFRRQDIVDNASPAYVGEFGTSTGPALYRRMAEADLLLVVGARLGEITTKSYQTLTAPGQNMRLVHIHPDADEIGRVFAPEFGLVSGVAEAAVALDGYDLGRRDDWGAWAELVRGEYVADIQAPNESPWQMDMGLALTQIRDSLPDDTIVTLDAGNHTGWAQRYLQFGRPGRELGSTCGAMGYAIPAAVAASLRHPDRLVLAFAGDGGFMMSMAELATAAQYGGKPIIILNNNGTYGTIRMHQEREYPGRVSGTELIHDDFCLMAKGMGAHAERVTQTADFAGALDRARAACKPAVIEVVTDPEQITSRTTITALRTAAQAKRKT